jgi:hypothetical protein
MPKLKFECQHMSGEKITYESDKEYLFDILEDFQNFLKGAGFVFDGVVDIIKENPSQMPPAFRYPTAERDYDNFG